VLDRSPTRQRGWVASFPRRPSRPTPTIAARRCPVGARWERTERTLRVPDSRAEGPALPPAPGIARGNGAPRFSYRPHGPTVPWGERLARCAGQRGWFSRFPRALPWAWRTAGPSARKPGSRLSPGSLMSDSPGRFTAPVVSVAIVKLGLGESRRRVSYWLHPTRRDRPGGIGLLGRPRHACLPGDFRGQR